MGELNREDILTIFQIISNILRFLGYAMIIPTIVALLYGESLFAAVFGTMAFVLTTVFSLVHIVSGKREAKFKHAIISIAIAWFIIGIFSTIPFLFAGISPVDSFFESISGWSGTGLSMVPEPEKLPFSINFWRGFIQWVGGFGIVILALLFYDRPETAQKLFLAEGRNEEFYTSVKRIAQIIVAIYAIYTVLGIVLLLFSGLNFFDAVIHSFTAIATGGYSTNAVGIGAFGVKAMLSTILLMLLGGISFESHRDLLRGQVRKFVSNPEVRLLFVVVAIASALIFLNSFLMKESHFFDSFFYVVSAISGTGATAVFSVAQLPALSIFVIILLMVSGACYGSTTGALKLWRILIVGKVIRREIYRAFLPAKTIVPLRLGNKPIDDHAALAALSYISLYIFFLAAGSVIFMFAGYGVIESVFTVSSAQGNVGLSVVSGSPWFGMDAILKILLSIHMILGRMEIIPFLVMVKSFGIIKRS